MKKTVFLILLSACFLGTYAQVKDPVIMTIAGQDVTKSEFEYIWNKNNANNSTDKKSLDEYINLFVNFKLKVAEAKAQGIDTTKAFITELKGYRRQLVTPYLTDKEAENKIYREAYDRGKQYIELSHILLRVNKDASPEDTLLIYKKMLDIYKKAISGQDFAKLAKEYSEDQSNVRGGYLGFTTGMNYVLPFEDVAFNTAIGQISKPFRSEFGYHILKVHSRRPAGGQFTAGHILKVVIPTDTPAEKAAIKDSIFEIYKSLQNGGDFTYYGTKKSDDRGASAHNGIYENKLCGEMPYEFEEAVYKLKPGEISAPFETQYGWHIVKAIEFKDYPTFEEAQGFLAKNLKQGDRAKAIKNAKIEKLKKEYHFVYNNQNCDQLLKQVQEFKKANDSILLKKMTESEATLFTVDGKEYTQKMFMSSTGRNFKYLSVKDLLNDYISGIIIDCEDRQLENKYPEFRNLMQEYKDGILLFEISNREVWEKASLDTAGLQTFFEANRKNYAWDKPRFKGFIIQCANAKVAKQARKMIKKLPADSVIVTLKRSFNTDSTTLIKVERGLYAKGENANVDFLTFKTGKLAPMNGFPEVFVSGRKLVDGPESYTDVRGLVISDYQNELENRWIKSLKDKFKVIVHKDVVNTVNKN